MSVNAAITYQSGVMRFSFTSSLSAFGFNFSVAAFDSSGNQTGMAYVQSNGQFDIGLKLSASVGFSAVFVKVSFSLELVINLSHTTFIGYGSASVTGSCGL